MKRDCECSNPMSTHVHGTETAYRRCGCRCDDCITAHHRREKRGRYLRSRGITAKVPIGPAQQRIIELLDAGVTIAQISTRSGIRKDMIADIRTGVYPRCYQETLDAILATPFPLINPMDNPDGYVNAIGVKRRVQALLAMGWPTYRIASEAGLSQSQIQSINRPRRKRVRTSTALAVVAAWDELWHREPRPLTDKGRTDVKRTRAHAKRRGWPSPLAWDEDIDDPKAEPRGMVQEVPSEVP